MAEAKQPGPRPVYSVVGDRYVFLATGAETSGACCSFEAHVPPGGGTPPHVHSREDELFYVIEGEFEFVVDGVPDRLAAGGSLLARRGIPHQFRNVGPGAGKMIITAAPAGLDEFFVEVGERLPGPDSPPVAMTPEAVDRLLRAAPKYGMQILGGPA